MAVLATPEHLEAAAPLWHYLLWRSLGAPYYGTTYYGTSRLPQPIIASSSPTGRRSASASGAAGAMRCSAAVALGLGLGLGMRCSAAAAASAGGRLATSSQSLPKRGSHVVSSRRLLVAEADLSGFCCSRPAWGMLA